MLFDLIFTERSIREASPDALVVWLYNNYRIPVWLQGLFVLPYNMAVLPFVTIYPPLEERIIGFLGINEPYYMLNSPLFKYILATAADITYVIILCFFLPGMSLAWHYFVLGWALVGLWAELQELITAEEGGVWNSIKIAVKSRFDYRVKSAYYGATLNFIDLPACVITIIALAMRVAELNAAESDGYELDLSGIVPPSGYVLASAVLLLWIRQLRILLNIPKIGPLVLMIIQMFDDITKWAAIMLVILIAFLSFFYVLRPECDAERLPLRLFGSMLTGDSPDVCLEEDDEVLGAVFTILFRVVAYVLMFNLLIAILSKTFDNISDAAVTNYQMLRAKLTLNWKDQESAPPPLRALGIPYDILGGLFCCGGKDDSMAAGGSMRKLNPEDLKSARENIKQQVRDYYSSRCDDATADSRWRVQLNKSISVKLNNLGERLEKSMVQLVREEVGTAYGRTEVEQKDAKGKIVLTENAAATRIKLALRRAVRRVQKARKEAEQARRQARLQMLISNEAAVAAESKADQLISPMRSARRGAAPLPALPAPTPEWSGGGESGGSGGMPGVPYAPSPRPPPTYPPPPAGPDTPAGVVRGGRIPTFDGGQAQPSGPPFEPVVP